MGFAPYRDRVDAAFIDANGHMNLAYYMVLFDRATDAALIAMGIGPDYWRARGNGVFVAEAHIVYARELLEDAPVEIESLLLAAEAKRLRLFHRMRHAVAGHDAATVELTCLHVDLASRKVTPMPDGEAARVAGFVTPPPWPPEAGRAIRWGS